MLLTLFSILPVFALILLGWVSGRAGWLPAGAVDVLNGCGAAGAAGIAVPVRRGGGLGEAVASGVCGGARRGIAVTFALRFFAAGGAGMAERCIEALAAAYANTAFIGIPLAQALFGTAGLAAAVIASLLTVCLLFAFTILLVEIDVHRDKRRSAALAGVGRSLLRNPLVAAPAAGALWALGGLAMPAPVHQVTALLGAAASPVALVTIGLFLAAAPRGIHVRAVAPIAALKLIGQPLATWGVALALGLPQPWRALAVLIAALPTGTGPFMLARLYKRESALVAQAILVTTLLSVLTVSAVALLMV